MSGNTTEAFAGLPYEQQNMTPGTSQRSEERALDDSVRQRFINLADFVDLMRHGDGSTCEHRIRASDLRALRAFLQARS